MHNRDLIIFPVAFILLMVTVLNFRFLFLNIRSARKREVNPRVYRTFDKPQMPEKNLLVMNNVSNLFEMPVFFFVLAAFLYASDSVDRLYLIFAWAYVLARLIHTCIHTTYNHVLHRLAAFIASNIILLVMWGRFVMQAWSRL